jgi:hypothetical protein
MIMITQQEVIGNREENSEMLLFRRRLGQCGAGNKVSALCCIVEQNNLALLVSVSW